MDITNVTDYDNVTSTNTTTCNCTDSENFIDIIIPAFLFTIPSGLSFSCLISLMVYTLNKPLIRKKIIFVKNKWRSFFIQNILLGV